MQNLGQKNSCFGNNFKPELKFRGLSTDNFLCPKLAAVSRIMSEFWRKFGVPFGKLQLPVLAIFNPERRCSELTHGEL